MFLFRPVVVVYICSFITQSTCIQKNKELKRINNTTGLDINISILSVGVIKMEDAYIL